MADKTLGKAFVQILPSTKGIKGNIEKALSPEAKKAGQEAGTLAGVSLGDKLGGALSSASKKVMPYSLAISGVGTAMMVAAKRTAATTDSIDKNSQRLGLSRKAYQEWNYVLSQSGIDINGVQIGLKQLVNKTEAAKNGSKSAIDSFKKLGLSVQDLKGKSQEDVFKMVIKSLQGMKKGSERAALANQLLGRSGQQMAPLLNQSTKSTEALIDKAHKMGIVLSDEAVDAGVNLTDAMDSFNRSMGAAKDTLAVTFMPYLTQAFDYIAMHGGDLQKIIKKTTTAVGNIPTPVKKAIVVILGVIAILGPALAIGAKIVGVISSIISVISTVAGFLSGLTPILGAVATAVGLPVGAVVAAGAAIVAVTILIVKNWNKIKAKTKALGKVILSIFTAIKKGTINKVTEIVNGIKKKFSAVKKAMARPFTDGKKLAIEAIKGLITGIIKRTFLLPTLLFKAGKKAISGFVKGIKNVRIPRLHIDWITESKGKGKGAISIPKPKLSWYATGGIFSRPTIAGIGEAGPEAVIPLGRFWSKMDQMGDSIVNGVALAMAGIGGDGDITVVTYLYPSGPKMDEYTVKSYDRGKKRLK